MTVATVLSQSHEANLCSTEGEGDVQNAMHGCFLPFLLCSILLKIVRENRATKSRQDLTPAICNECWTLHIVISNVCYSWLLRLTAVVEPPQMQWDSTVYLTVIIPLALHNILRAISSFQKMAWRLIDPQSNTLPPGPPSSSS